MTYEVFVVSCIPEGGIFRYELNQEGMLSFLDRTLLQEPMYLIRQQEEFYAVLKQCFADGSGGMQKLIRSSNGSLVPDGETISTRGGVPCHLCLWDSKVYCANYATGSIICLPDHVVTHHGSSVHPTRQDKAHVHFVCVTPDKRYLAAVDLGMDQIVTYDKDLKRIFSSSLPPGSGARHLAFSQDGTYAYCVGELAGTVTVLRYQNGKFLPLETYSLLPSDYIGKNLAAAVRRWEDTLYVSNRGHDSIARFLIRGQKLIPLGWFDCGGREPRDFEITKEWILCTNQTGNCVTVLDRETGEQVHQIKVNQPLGVVIGSKE